MHWSPQARDLARAAGALTLDRVLANQAMIRPDAVAVEYIGGALTYTELHDASSRLASTLADEGVQPGDRIAVLSENTVELCVLLYAAAKLGATCAVLNWRLFPHELGYCIDLVEPRLVCYSAARAELAELARPETTTAADFVPLGALDDTDDRSPFGRSSRYPSLPPNVYVDPESILTIMYTSGTTGLPKAAAISHRALVARAGVMAAELRLSREDAFIGWAPMFHMVSTDYMFLTHLYGGKYVVLPGFDPEAIVDVLLRDRVGWFVLMPATITRIIDELRRRDAPVRGVRAVGAMADLVPPEQLATLTGLLGAPYFNSFGSTEMGTVPSAGALLTAGELPTDFAKEQTAFVDVALVAASGEPAEDGEVGELLMRGPTAFSGYWNDDGATRAVFAGGWYHSGDLFTRTEDGRLNFVSRSRYMIKSGGENIYPAEIERVLMQHPDVVEVVVVRRADDRWGEVPVAVVAVKDGATTGPEHLGEFCVEYLASYKRPKEIQVRALEEFPRNVTGKVLREELEVIVADRREASA